MDPKRMAQGVAGGRLAFGLGFMLVPGLTGKLWIGGDASRPAVKVLTQAIGARDLAMGMGALMAMSQGKPARGWMEGIALTDAADFVWGLLARDRIPPPARIALLVLAGSSAAQAAYAATGVDD